MLLKNIFTGALLLNAFFLSAQNTILWKVTKPGNKHVSWLLGTHHLFGESFVNSFPIIEKKLDASDLIITETKLDRKKVIAYYDARRSSDSLFTILPKQDIDFINHVLKNMKIDVSKLTPGELFLRLQVFYPKFKCPVMNAEDKFVMDEYIQHLAGRKKKKLYFLETDSFQLDKINELTKNINWDFFKRRFPSLLASYRDKTPDEKLCSLVNQYASFTIDYKLSDSCKSENDMMLNKRNEDWMLTIPRLLDKHNCFVGLGQGHFYNKCGIIMRLREMGYVVEQVDMQSGKIKSKE